MSEDYLAAVHARLGVLEAKVDALVALLAPEGDDAVSAGLRAQSVAHALTYVHFSGAGRH